jgi:hypothetical protein
MFLFICQSDYVFRPQFGHHQVTSRLYKRELDTFSMNPTQQTWQKQTKFYNLHTGVRTLCGEPNDCQKQQNFGTLV